jgi:Transglutaminase-like superfamily
MRAHAPIIGLSPHVHGVAIDDDAVFLDVAGDRYLAVPGAAGRLVLGPARRVLGVADPAFASELCAAGLAGGPCVRGPAAPLPTATASALPEAVPPPVWRDAPAAASAMADLARAYWRRPLLRLTQAAARGATPEGAEPPTPALLATVADYHRWAPFAPAPGKCLLRSFLLLRLLRRRGHDARWVFGVRTWPFRAHCWLQRGTVVLDDDLETLVPLTPILVV